tara:strand:- start:1192 stop:3573 length:2382 start_codon:yes stop_codon:yes gene_type:complete
MNNRRISAFLAILMLTPFITAVQADGTDESYLEAKSIQAIVDSINETVTLSWQNVDTFDFIILEGLKTTNYSLYRSDEPLNSSNYQQAELVRDQIQACMASDSLNICKNREHSVVYTIPPTTDGNFYYGIISTLENGSVTDNFSLGDSALQQPVYEYGSPITSPYALQATYDADNSTTQLGWIDVSRVDPTVDSNHSTSIWSHAMPANYSNWDTMNKTQIGAALPSSANSFEITHPNSLSRSIYYTVTHSFDGQEDTRFLSNNTLTQALLEDNIGSLITGNLQAQFNSSSSQTSLNWTGSLIEDVNHTLHIWHSISSISDIQADGVEELTQLSANSTHYNLTVSPGFNRESYYLITLSDELGNHQTNLTAAPSMNVHEFTLLENQNMVTDLSASHIKGVTHLTWTDLENHSEATYQVWRSTTGQITSSNFVSTNVALLATVDAGIEEYNHSLESGVSIDAWYAVTAVASFGTQNLTFPQSNISVSLNSLSNAVVEDTKSPLAPVVLGAAYHVNGTTQISWTGDGLEQGTTWEIYRNLYTDMNVESHWTLVGFLENSGTTQHTIFVSTVAQFGQTFTPVYAISGTDSFGNSIAFEDWTLSVPVLEDRTSPNVQIKLYDSEMNVETSRWFNGGETATFTNLASGAYTLKFAVIDDAVTIDYVISTDASSSTLDLSDGVPQMSLQLSKQMENITVSFTVTDATGNTAIFSTQFCTTCLIQEEVVEQIDEPIIEEEIIENQNEGDEDSNTPVFIGVIIGLVVAILFLVMRSPKPSKGLSGLPSTSEDQWISVYTREK